MDQASAKLITELLQKEMEKNPASANDVARIVVEEIQKRASLQQQQSSTLQQQQMQQQQHQIDMLVQQREYLRQQLQVQTTTSPLLSTMVPRSSSLTTLPRSSSLTTLPRSNSLNTLPRSDSLNTLSSSDSALAHSSGFSSSSCSTPRRESPPPECPPRPRKRSRDVDQESQYQYDLASDSDEKTALLNPAEQLKRDRADILHETLEFFDEPYLAPRISTLFAHQNCKTPNADGTGGDCDFFR